MKKLIMWNKININNILKIFFLLMYNFAPIQLFKKIKYL